MGEKLCVCVQLRALHIDQVELGVVLAVAVAADSLQLTWRERGR